METEITQEIKVNLLKAIKDVLIKTKNVYDSAIMIEIFQSYEIKMPSDLELLLENIDIFLKNLDDEKTIMFVNTLYIFLTNSKRAILTKTDFTLLYRFGIIEYFDENNEVQQYSFKTIFLDLGLVIKVHPIKIKKFINNAWFRLNNILSIIDFDAKCLNNNEEIIDKIIEDPDTLESIITDISMLTGNIIEKYKNNDYDLNNRCGLTNIIRDIVSSEEFDKFVTILISADIKYYHYRLIYMFIVDFLEKVKSIFIGNFRIYTIIDHLFKNSRNIINTIVVEYKTYYEFSFWNEVLVLVKKIASDIPDNIVSNDILNVIQNTSMDNLMSYYEYIKNVFYSLSENDVNPGATSIKQKTVTKKVYK
jgi:hypothetical protein